MLLKKSYFSGILTSFLKIYFKLLRSRTNTGETKFVWTLVYISKEEMQ